MSGLFDAVFPGIGKSPVESVLIASLVTRDSPRLTAEVPEHIRLLAESETPFPPIVVHRGTMRVVDGLHRIRAAQLRGAESIDARFVAGAERDLFPLAVLLNVAHGLPLSAEDRRAAAARILLSHPQWSDRLVAEATGLAARTVGAIRRASAPATEVLARIGKDGRRRPLSSAAGRHSAGELIRANPTTPLRQVASAAGISLGTASDVRARVLRGEDPVPRAAARVAAGPAAGPRDGRDAAELLRRLTTDPSLRFNESGRGLLRWLGGHLVRHQEWQGVMEELPGHCVGTVAELARVCGESWLELADQLERRRVSA